VPFVCSCLSCCPMTQLFLLSVQRQRSWHHPVHISSAHCPGETWNRKEGTRQEIESESKVKKIAERHTEYFGTGTTADGVIFNLVENLISRDISLFPLVRIL
jgi:hypothetical protein